MEPYRRWRHRRGFGVHSPFAFAVVNDVVRDRCAYYCYDELRDEVFEGGGRGRDLHAMKMLVRLVGRLAPSSAVVLSEKMPPYLHHVIALADSRLTLTDKMVTPTSGMMVMMRGDRAAEEWLAEVLRTEGCIVLVSDCDNALMNRIRCTLPQGLVLYDSKAVMAFNRPEMQKVEYACRF